jgi:putative transposase
MTMPREITPGTTYEISRRCLMRMFLLLPEEYVTSVFAYCLAYAATEFNILIHAFTAMSNHFHLVLTDLDGCLPLFMERLDVLLARAINAHWGRRGAFFEQGSYSAVRLETPEDGMGKIVYALTNPVKAGLVSHVRKWKGASSFRWEYGQTRRFSRPDGQFFRRGSKLPKEVKLTLTPVAGYEQLSEEQFGKLVAERVREREVELRAEFRAQGRSFLGTTGVLRCKPTDRPSTREARRKLNPRVAGKDPAVRVEAIARLRAFREKYRKAWLAWRHGDHTAVFPAGTWLMRVRHGAVCEPPS